MITISDRGYWITGTIVIMGIIGQWLDGPRPALASQLWILPAALLVAALFAERAALAAMQLDVKREVPQQVYLGESFACELILANNGRRDIHLEFQASYPEHFAANTAIRRYRIPREGRLTDLLQLQPLQLGKSGLGDVHIKVLGFMGLVWWYRRIEDDVDLQVVPLGVTNRPRTMGERLAGARYSRTPVQGGLEFLLHREYQQGDPLQIVDWKASARSNEMMVRVMTREQRMELVMLLDCGRTSQLQSGKLTRLHHNVNIVARLAELAVSHGDRIACITYADQPLAMMPLASGLDSLRKNRAILRNARSVPMESNMLAAALQARKMLGHRALVVALTDISTGGDASQFSQAVRLLSTKHLVVIASIDDTEIKTMRWREASHWMDPYRNFAATEYCRQQKLTTMKLKQHGASVITAAPEELDKRVLDYYRELRQRIAV